jgi:hypothetical protein
MFQGDQISEKQPEAEQEASHRFSLGVGSSPRQEVEWFLCLLTIWSSTCFFSDISRYRLVARAATAGRQTHSKRHEFFTSIDQLHRSKELRPLYKKAWLRKVSNVSRSEIQTCPQNTNFVSFSILWRGGRIRGSEDLRSYFSIASVLPNNHLIESVRTFIGGTVFQFHLFSEWRPSHRTKNAYPI